MLGLRARAWVGVGRMTMVRAPLSVLGSCDRPCATCDDRFACLNKKALLQPEPWYFWALLAAAVGVPLYLTLDPRRAASAVVSRLGGAVAVDEPTSRARYQALFERIGLRYPERVLVVETESYGPTSFGMDSRFGSVIFLPHAIAALWDPRTQVTFPGIYEGPVGQMGDDVRRMLLQTEGTLIPTPEQCEFIIGHEASHLLRRHTYETSKIGLFVALFTHLALKTNNALVPVVVRATGWRTLGHMRVRSTPVFAALVVSVTVLVTAALSWDQELEADAESAERLHLHRSAIQLKEEQLVQARVHEAAHGPTPWLERDLEHPPTALQLYSLRKNLVRTTNAKQ